MAAARNPSELLIFGNPKKRGKAARARGARAKRTKKNSPKFDAQKAARERAEKIRKAGGNAPKEKPLGHKAGCKCFACKHARGGNPRTRQPKKKQSAGSGRRSNKSRRLRRNPNETEQAVRLFETFHGKDASSIAEKHVSAAIRKDYTALGHLEKLIVRTPLGQDATFDFDGDGVMLASSPDGKQLYCIGGRQNLLSCLDEDSQQKDFIDLGECLQVEYLARKVHSNYEPTTWYHKFGEKTGARPQLMFDKLKKQIFFVGGEYFIDPKVDLSPGIEN